MVPDASHSATDLAQVLRRYWGYDTFRPLQERIIRSVLGGKDIAVIMPTGGGKSLCYQIPALVSGGTAVVVSPLISLMQDQAAQLAQMGIPAAVLNSARTQPEQAHTMRQACQGAYRLLYLSPERLARQDTIGWLARVPVSYFAIDEAHCISEWGHEFRPEYRQLSRLREQFPDKPIAAFTASATRRVRHDIIDQLKLNEPDKYIASFHRPNLRYLVHQCDSQTHRRLLVNAVRAAGGDNLIVYAPTVAKVEETVDLLGERGIPAVAYHGQMENQTRQRNQERWMSDEVPVLVGTLAFGLGINKAAVRAVIHLALPKSIEQYYQEAGRAGRDGLPADCLLLWQPKDAGLLAYFIDKLRDPGERERAWERYHAIRRYAESGRCRHREICVHFGETPKWASCGMCDVCAPEPEWLRPQSPQVDRRQKKQVAKAVPPAVPEADRELLEWMREWRRELAKRKGTPAFMILPDASLLDLCAQRPRLRAELQNVTGIGERKAEQFGDEILAALASFDAGQRSTPKLIEPQLTPEEETIQLLEEGRSFPEIARIRDRQLSTVVGMVADLVERGRIPFQDAWVSEAHRTQIETVVQRVGSQWLKPLREALPTDISAEEIRLVVAKCRSTFNKDLKRDSQQDEGGAR